MIMHLPGIMVTLDLTITALIKNQSDSKHKENILLHKIVGIKYYTYDF